MALLSYENKRGSGKKLKVHFELPKVDDYHSPHKKDSRSSISSNSSLDSNDDDDDDSEKDDHYNIDDFDSKSDNSNVWSYNGGSVTHSPPPMQMMSTTSGYDPNRIPSCVFSSPNHMEWSVQSNESLFSIHLGNTSFSRDHVFAANNKSGEFPWTNDGISMPNPMMLPSVQEVDHDNKQVERHSISSSSSSDTSEEAASLVMENDEHKKVESSPVVDQTPKDHSKEVNQAMVIGDAAKNYNNVSYQSMESDRSFQFPILTMDGRMNSSSILESEKEGKNEHQQQQQQKQQNLEKIVELSKPETEKDPPRKGRRCWCFYFSCLPCCFR